MRVALVCPYDLRVPGGVQAHVRDLAVALRERDDTVAVVGPGAGGVSGGRDVGSSVPVPFNDAVAPVALAPPVVPRTVRALRRFDPDVVHVHEPAVPLVSATAVWRARRPVVGTYHAWSDSDRTYRLVRPVARRLHARLAAAIAVSAPARRYHAGALGVPPRTLTVIPNGVDVAAHAAAPADAPEAAGEGPVLLFLGRLEPRKGLAEAIQAFARLKVERPGLRLLIAGEGPERERCEALLPERLRAGVRFLGYVVDGDKRRLLRSCDLLVAPALGGESFGIVLVEALAAGLPVVASDIPGYASVLTDGRDGRLVPPGDVHGLARAVGALLDNPALRRALAEEGTRTARQYDWGVVAERIREMYAAAVGTPVR